MRAAAISRPLASWASVDRRIRAVVLTAAGAIGAVLLLGTDLVLPRSTPPGIILLGACLGGLNALLAIGIILVFRTNRIINFAHGELGAFSGVLVSQLIATGQSYVVAVACGLTSGVLAAAFIEVAIIRRFANAPRLILTVATIALSNLLIFAELSIPRLFGDPRFSSELVTPLTRFRFRIAPVTFDGNHVVILVVVVAVAVGLGAFLRSDHGIAVRASVENRDRAGLCGIPVKGVATLVWAIAGGLSALAATLQAPVIGLQVGTLVGPNLLVRALAAAVIGRMRSLPITVAAALGLAILEQSIYWGYGRSTVIDVVLLGVILLALVFQPPHLARSDDTSTTADVVATVRPIPAELATLSIVRRGRIALLLAVGVVAVVGPTFLSLSKQNLAAVIVIFGIIGLSLVVLTGWAGQISLGQFALVGVGAAVAGSVSADLGWDLVLSLAASGAAGTVAALVLGVPALRVKGFFLAVTTLAFAIPTSSYLLRQEWLIPEGAVDRPRLFGRVDLESELADYFLCLAVLVLVIVGLRGIRSSRVGRAIVAVRDNERAAQAYGVDAVIAKLTAFAVSGFVAGLAGGLLVHHQHGLPATQYAPQQSLSVFLLTVIGGLGSIPGALVGGLYVKGTQYLLAGPASFLASGAGVLLLLLVLPKGLGSLLYDARDAVLRRIAAHRGIVVASLLADVRTDGGRSSAAAVDDAASDVSDLFAEPPMSRVAAEAGR